LLPAFPRSNPNRYNQLTVSQTEDETALNAAWAILKHAGVPDGLLGVFYHEARQTFVLHYEEEGSGYTEWVRLSVIDLEHLYVDALEEAAERLVKRIHITRARFIPPETTRCVS
jgi:hypothetical protein